MFRITMMCEDKNLAKTLVALASVKALNVEPTPVLNAKRKGNGVSEVGAPGACGVILRAFPVGTKFNGRQMNAALREGGLGPNSQAIKKLVKTGEVKKVRGSKGLYYERMK